MDFNYTETQDMIRDTMARFLADNSGFETRQKMIGSEIGRDPAIWQALAQELGMLGASFAEEHGGLGGGHLENAIIMEEMGRAIAIEPYLQTVVLGGGALKAVGGAQAEAVIPQIISGEAILAFAYAEPQGRYNLANLTTTAKKDGAGYVLNGHKAVVHAAPWATHLLITARSGGDQSEREGISLFLIDASADGVVKRDYPTVDGLRASEVYLENVAVGGDALLGDEGGALPVIEQIVDEATAALCHEAVGVMQQLHGQTLEYAKQRNQFGQPIGRFQVLQHRIVDMFLELEQARSMALMATLKLDMPADERKAAVSQAKAKIAKACQITGQSAVQTHGGIGITQELAVGHYFMRATMIEKQFGDADHHFGRYEALALAE